MSSRAAAAALALLAALAFVLAWSLVAPGEERDTRDPPRGAPAVVVVAVPGSNGVDEVATGFAAGDGRVVTVAHALGGRRDPSIRAGGENASVRGIDERLDLAVLAAGAGRSRAPRFAMWEGGRVAVLVRRGDETRALPARIRHEITFRLGTIARPALAVEADVEHGDSGAPIVDADGRVVGVLFARSRERERTAYAVAADAVRQFLTASAR